MSSAVARRRFIADRMNVLYIFRSHSNKPIFNLKLKSFEIKELYYILCYRVFNQGCRCIIRYETDDAQNCYGTARCACSTLLRACTDTTYALPPMCGVKCYECTRRGGLVFVSRLSSGFSASSLFSGVLPISRLCVCVPQFKHNYK